MTDEMMRLTYAELARTRGVSIGAARRMVQRHKWPKQIGNDGLSRVSIPATFLICSNAGDDDVAPDISEDVVKDVGNAVSPDIIRDATGLQVISFDEALPAFASVIKDVTTDVSRNVAKDVATDIIAMLRDQLVTERERADRAETRAAEFQQQLQTEMIEHRRVVGLLAEQLAARRSWWPWRR